MSKCFESIRAGRFLPEPFTGRLDGAPGGPTAGPIQAVLSQHVEEAAALRYVRSCLVVAPHVELHHLQRLDGRIEAHLDGLAVAGEHGWQLCQSALQTPGAGEVFVATVRALEDKNFGRLERLLALAEAVPQAQSGLVSAFGWVSTWHLKGIVDALLSSSSAYGHLVGIAACSMHRVNPGAALKLALGHGNVALRARALRTAGELGRRDLLAPVLEGLCERDSCCGFWAAWAAVLLGERSQALSALADHGRTPGPWRQPALQLVLCAMDMPAARDLLEAIVRHSGDERALIQGVGIVGDPRQVPWLIERMEAPHLARLAGESFSFITGCDLAALDLERRPPQDGAPNGPTESSQDEDVTMDPDEHLLWPEPQKVNAWWQANRQRLQGGVRIFMGEPVTREHCRRVLGQGFQRQRGAAALHLALLDPGTKLFGTRAPAWRQRRWLDQTA